MSLIAFWLSMAWIAVVVGYSLFAVNPASQDSREPQECIGPVQENEVRTGEGRR